MTVLYAALHALVDGVCAWAMLGFFSGDCTAFLIYNFCAFALQFPLGAVLDRLGGKKMPAIFAAAGCGLTLLGAFTCPAVLGLGNALFHVGGGVDVIRRDGRCAALGIFVAPGALGLYLGGLLTGRGNGLLPAALVLGAGLLLSRAADTPVPEPRPKAPIPLVLCCFAVVVLRSHVGMTTAFPWKHGALALAAVCAVAAGKALGGILAERFGMSRVTICSLGMSAVAFALGDIPVFGLLALLCFNMTMPLTLFALWRRFPGYPGTVFGALTLALFVGFLPAYFGIDLPVGGVLGSILSLALLWRAVDHV